MDTVFELPDRPTVLLADPVDGAASQRVSCPGRKADSAGLVAEGKLPALDEEVLAEVFRVVVAEREPRACDDRPDESLGVVNVVQLQRQWRFDSSGGTFGIP